MDFLFFYFIFGCARTPLLREGFLYRWCTWAVFFIAVPGLLVLGVPADQSQASESVSETDQE